MVLPEIVSTDQVVGFDEDYQDDTKLIKPSTKKLGGFHRLDLNSLVLKGIKKRGYKTPTPIQRKAIPLIMEGRDVVAMARTGSGKTACFLIPLFEKLLAKQTKNVTRALILSPTRELALQTLKFVKELGRFCGVRGAVVLGGDSMDSQFSMMHSRPDILIATPGRFLHLCVEMELKLSEMEYVVFDEADRLFEMGFGVQLQEIIHRLPDSRQTLLFSATLPKVLVEFARAGLTDPVLLRLDVESKLPESLELSFVSCRADEKPAVLMCLLDHVVQSDAQVAIFVATKHHVEYVHMLLEQAQVTNTYIYSDLDPSARKINAAKFQKAKVRALIVTDVAARGLDIPNLDYVINYNFPAKAKLFVHRVGRCARAGRAGTALSLVSGDELCYLLDLCLFLGRPLTCATVMSPPAPGALGRIPQNLVDDQLSKIMQWHSNNSALTSQKKVSENAYKQYLKSRPGASVDSVRRVKELPVSTLGSHDAFTSFVRPHMDRTSILAQIKSYKPQGTVFEFGQSSHIESYKVMKIKRDKDNEKIMNYKQKDQNKVNIGEKGEDTSKVKLELSDTADINRTFSKVILPAKRREVHNGGTRKKRKMGGVDQEHFIPYKSADAHTEQGLAVENFHQTANEAILDLTGDTEQAMRKTHRAKMVWDKKRGKMVGVDIKSKVGKIRGESGTWIPATFKSGRYKEWVERNKAANDDSDSADEDNTKNLKITPHTRWGRHNMKMQHKAKINLKNPDQILKQRILAEKRQKKNAKKKKKKK